MAWSVDLVGDVRGGGKNMKLIPVIALAAILAASPIHRVAGQDVQRQRQIVLDSASETINSLVYAIICEDHGLLPKFELSASAVAMLNAMDAELEVVDVQPQSVRDYVVKSPQMAELRSTFGMITRRRIASVTEDQRAQLQQAAKQECAIKLQAVERRGAAYSRTGSVIAK